MKILTTCNRYFVSTLVTLRKAISREERRTVQWLVNVTDQVNEPAVVQSLYIGCNATVNGGAVLVYGRQTSEDTWVILGGTTTYIDYDGFIDIYAGEPSTIV